MSIGGREGSRMTKVMPEMYAHLGGGGAGEEEGRGGTVLQEIGEFNVHTQIAILKLDSIVAAFNDLMLFLICKATDKQ